jgi:hypothetical protein
MMIAPSTNFVTHRVANVTSVGRQAREQVPVQVTALYIKRMTRLHHGGRSD